MAGPLLHEASVGALGPIAKQPNFPCQWSFSDALPSATLVWEQGNHKFTRKEGQGSSKSANTGGNVNKYFAAFAQHPKHRSLCPHVKLQVSVVQAVAQYGRVSGSENEAGSYPVAQRTGPTKPTHPTHQWPRLWFLLQEVVSLD